MDLNTDCQHGTFYAAAKLAYVRDKVNFRNIVQFVLYLKKLPGYEPGAKLILINKTKGYEPGNIRWRA
jgi:hypothetical protein